MGYDADRRGQNCGRTGPVQQDGPPELRVLRTNPSSYFASLTLGSGCFSKNVCSKGQVPIMAFHEGTVRFRPDSEDLHACPGARNYKGKLVCASGTDHKP